MKIVSSQQMRELENRCSSLGISTTMLMDNAGLAVAREMKHFVGNITGARILVLVGPGNNGGDSLVAACHLHDWGGIVHLYLISPRGENPNFRKVVERGIAWKLMAEDDGLKGFQEALATSEVVLDAVFGIGRNRPMEGKLKEVFQRLEESRRAKGEPLLVALDLPSGLNADTGEVDPATPKADVTITLGYPKLGLFKPPGAERVGRLRVVDIGIPPSLAEDISVEVITSSLVKSLLPPRPITAHKGTFGRVLVVAGSANYVGAAFLACEGAYRVGAGLVTLATASSLHPILASKLTETTHLPLPEASPGLVSPDAAGYLKDQLQNCECLLVGCGLGQALPVAGFLEKLLFTLPSSLPLVVDADGLNLLARFPEWWKRLASPAILTPHPGEMSRLLGIPTGEVQGRRLETAQRAARQWGKVVVLKGAFTVVAHPQVGVRVSPWANPGLASGGTGDVLAGAVAGFLAQGLSAYDAAACGVYIHGLAGEMARGSVGEAGMVASDLLPLLPKAITEVKKGRESP